MAVKSQPENLVARVRRETLAAATAATAAVEELRARIYETKARIAEIEARPCSRGEAEQRARTLVAELGKGVPSALHHLLAAQPPAPIFPLADARRALTGTDAAELLAAVVPDRMIAWAMSELDHQAEVLGGWSPLDADERRHGLDGLKDELLSLEREEENLILAGEEAGLTIHRRPDADPRAVLGLDLEPAPRRQPPPALGRLDDEPPPAPRRTVRSPKIPLSPVEAAMVGILPVDEAED